MKVLPISSNQQQFKARLPKSAFDTIVTSAWSKDKDAGMQKLYTLLQALDKIPGEKAEIKSVVVNNQSNLIGYRLRDSHICQLKIDGKLIEEGSNIFDVLYSAVTSSTTKDGKKIKMPGAVFDIMWWENRDKTRDDVMELLI